MEFKAHQVKRRKAALRMVILGSTLGVLYPVLFEESLQLSSLLNGLFIGFIGSLLVVIFEYIIFNPMARTYSFLTVIAAKTILYFLGLIMIILLVKSLIDSIFNQIGYFEYVTGEKFRHFILHEDFHIILLYTLIMLTIIVFNLQISRKFGYDVLINFITGKYHKPTEEDRVFMYVDLKSSTSITDKLGDLKYHQLLNDFYFDITKCILSTEGNIYRYVGDEIAVTWKLSQGLKNSNCIHAFIYINYVLKKEQEKYLNKYGFIPQFSTSFHSGKVVVSEIGEVKSQIVYNGEPIIITSLVEKECSRLNKSVLITSDLLNQLEIPPVYRPVKSGHVNVESLKKDMDLYSLEEYEENEPLKEAQPVM